MLMKRLVENVDDLLVVDSLVEGVSEVGSGSDEVFFEELESDELGVQLTHDDVVVGVGVDLEEESRVVLTPDEQLLVG